LVKILLKSYYQSPILLLLDKAPKLPLNLLSQAWRKIDRICFWNSLFHLKSILQRRIWANQYQLCIFEHSFTWRPSRNTKWRKNLKSKTPLELFHQSITKRILSSISDQINNLLKVSMKDTIASAKVQEFYLLAFNSMCLQVAKWSKSHLTTLFLFKTMMCLLSSAVYCTFSTPISRLYYKSCSSSKDSSTKSPLCWTSQAIHLESH